MMVIMFSSEEGWKKISEVGRGAYGFVSLHQHASGRKVIIKQLTFEKDSKSNLEILENEVKVLDYLEHPNIIAYYSNFILSDTLHIVMEYAPHGTLTDYLKNQNQVLLSSDEVLHWFCQLLMALSYLHAKQILHRDIKPQNILLSGEKGNILKLSDFGLAKILSSSFATSVLGTPEYMAPEMCQGFQYTCQSDIWSMGCVLYNLVTLKHPFKSDTIADLVTMIIRGQFEEPVDCPIYGKTLCEIIKSMLMPNPSFRPTTAILMAHPLVAQKLYYLPLSLGVPSLKDNNESIPLR